tara:strand:- start:89 stop:211 length:123 start_codon:yes stop_codon:yes gene_type:complete
MHFLVEKVVVAAAALAAAHRSHFRPSVVRLIWPAMALASV